MSHKSPAAALALALAITLSLLSGCALLPSGSGAAPPPRQARADIQVFTLDGRIAVQQATQRHSSNLSWRHAAARDEMLFATPLGQGLAELTRDSGGARLLLADRREFVAADWEGLAAQVFGFSLPLSALSRWLVGAVPATARDVALDALGRPQHLLSDGWRIDYLDYESAHANALPTLIELRRAEDDIEVRLKIDEWQVVR